MIAQDIPVQIEVENENDEEEGVGPCLPGQEERKPTAETLQALERMKDESQSKQEKKHTRPEWMTLMPDESSLASAFRMQKPRRFSKLPPGCKVGLHLFIHLFIHTFIH